MLRTSPPVTWPRWHDWGAPTHRSARGTSAPATGPASWRCSQRSAAPSAASCRTRSWAAARVTSRRRMPTPHGPRPSWAGPPRGRSTTCAPTPGGGRSRTRTATRTPDPARPTRPAWTAGRGTAVPQRARSGTGVARALAMTGHARRRRVRRGGVAPAQQRPDAVGQLDRDLLVVGEDRDPAARAQRRPQQHLGRRLLLGVARPRGDGVLAHRADLQRLLPDPQEPLRTRVVVDDELVDLTTPERVHDGGDAVQALLLLGQRGGVPLQQVLLVPAD